MPPLLRASIGLHALAAGATIAAPPLWPWALSGVVLDHALLTAGGLIPRSAWLGPNLTHLGPASTARAEIALTLDDGPDPELTPAVLDLLDAAGARATFFCIGRRARAWPTLTRHIVERGHSVQNHSLAHRHVFSLLGPRAMAAEVGQAQDILADITGVRPTCFRAPAGLRNPWLDPILHRLDLRLVSWTRRAFDTREPRAERVVARLTRGLAGGDILLLHDHHAARDANGRAVVLDSLPALLRAVQAAGLHSITLPQAMDHQAAPR